jgi:hypothetical protein
MLSPEALTYGTLLIARLPRPPPRPPRGPHAPPPVRCWSKDVRCSSTRSPTPAAWKSPVCEYGATLTSIRVPDIHGRLGEVTLGLRSLETTIAGNPFLGSTVGRYANRLADGRLTVDGQTIALAQNNHGNHLHGGLRGLDKRVWSSEAVRTESASSVRFTYDEPRPAKKATRARSR